MSINGIQSTVWLRIVGFTNEVISKRSNLKFTIKNNIFNNSNEIKNE